MLVVGGGCGGVAAALAATALGRSVVLTEAEDRLGGQLTSQAVPPDEHPWVEGTGTTASYRQLRDGVRDHYRRTRRLTEKAQRDPQLNPGAAWVSNLSAEPEVFRAVLDDLLRPAQELGLLRIRRRHRPVGTATDGGPSRRRGLRGQRGRRAALRYRGASCSTPPRRATCCPWQAVSSSSVRSPLRTRANRTRWTGRPTRPTSRRSPGARRWSGDRARTDTVERPAGYDFWRRYRADFWPGPQLGLGHGGARDRLDRCGGRCSAGPASRTCGRSAGSVTAATTGRPDTRRGRS